MSTQSLTISDTCSANSTIQTAICKLQTDLASLQEIRTNIQFRVMRPFPKCGMGMISEQQRSTLFLECQGEDPQRVRKSKFLAPLNKSEFPNQEFINKAKNLRTQCDSDRFVADALTAGQPKVLTHDKPIVGAHIQRVAPPAGWQRLTLTVDSGASETVIP